GRTPDGYFQGGGEGQHFRAGVVHRIPRCGGPTPQCPVPAADLPPGRVILPIRSAAGANTCSPAGEVGWVRAGMTPDLRGNEPGQTGRPAGVVQGCRSVIPLGVALRLLLDPKQCGRLRAEAVNLSGVRLVLLEGWSLSRHPLDTAAEPLQGRVPVPGLCRGEL